MLRPTIGALSIASGVALIVLPGPVARMYGLPRRLAPVLGARDVAIGFMMLVPTTAKAGTYLRAVSDAVDAALIAGERKDGTLATIGRVIGAVGLSLTSLASARQSRR